MHLLFKQFFSICLFRSGPQDLPSSTFLLALSLLAYSLVGLLLALNQTTLLPAAAMVGFDITLLAGLTWALLWSRRVPYRFTQTLTALAGCSALLALCAWPLLLWQQSSGNDNIIILAALLMWLWFFWQVMVFSHIIAQVLSTPLFVGTTLALVYMYISYSIAQTLFYQETL